MNNLLIKYQPEFKDNRKTIIAEENRKKYLGNNKNGKLFCKYRIDNYVIKENNIPKCDYLIINCDDNICYFIELKGSDLTHAITQIDNAIEILMPSLKSNKINARIVLSKVRTPDIIDSRLIKFKKKIKKLNGTLVQSVNILWEDI